MQRQNIPYALKNPFLSPWKETGFCIPKERRRGSLPCTPNAIWLVYLTYIIRRGCVSFVTSWFCTAPGEIQRGGRSPLLAAQGEGLGRGRAGRGPSQAHLCALSGRTESVITQLKVCIQARLPIRASKNQTTKPERNRSGFRHILQG